MGDDWDDWSASWYGKDRKKGIPPWLVLVAIVVIGVILLNCIW